MRVVFNLLHNLMNARWWRFKAIEVHVCKLSTGHSGKYHNALCLSPYFCISIVSNFSWDLQWSQEKEKRKLIAKFWGTNKQYYGIFRNAKGFGENKIWQNNVSILKRSFHGQRTSVSLQTRLEVAKPFEELEATLVHLSFFVACIHNSTGAC